jgi:hypothetical protein
MGLFDRKQEIERRVWLHCTEQNRTEQKSETKHLLREKKSWLIGQHSTTHSENPQIPFFRVFPSESIAIIGVAFINRR